VCKALLQRLIDERAATRGRTATEGGDERVWMPHGAAEGRSPAAPGTTESASASTPRTSSWQTEEVQAFIRRAVKQHHVVIPVIMPKAKRSQIPVFLEGREFVDIDNDPDPLGKLIWGITGKKPLSPKTPIDELEK